MVHTTKGIVLRTTAYGETSVIALVYTELFGLQSYMVNGVRSNKKGNTKGNIYQPGSIIEMEVYHNELKKLHRVRETRWHYIYRDILFNIYKNATVLFMIELLQKTIRQPEENPDLYNFIEDALIELDKAGTTTAANYPLFFLVHLPAFLGFSIQDNYSVPENILNLKDGRFVAGVPHHEYYVPPPLSEYISDLMHVRHPSESEQIPLNNATRRQITDHLLHFYRLHIQDFASMRSLSVLQQVFS